MHLTRFAQLPDNDWLSEGEIFQMAEIKNTPIFTAFFVFLIVILSSCGGGGGSSPNSSSGPPASNVVSAVIGAAGGSLTSSDGNATITIPAGALSSDTTITATWIATTSARLSAALGGSGGALYEFGPADTVLNSDASFSFTYDPADLPGRVVNAGLRIAMNKTDYWQLADSDSNDPATKTVSGTFSQLGTIGVVYVMTAQLDTA